MPLIRNTLRSRPLAPALLALTAWFAAAESHAGDWPQILGPQRNGRAVDEPAPQPWPAAGPRALWSYSLGTGYAGPAVVADRVIVFHRAGDQERVEALDAATGKPQWKADFAASYAGGVNPDNGPRCVPLVHEGRVYVFGAAGDLHCVNLADGAKVWSRAAYADFGGLDGYFGAGSTPIAADGKLVVNVGGRQAGLVAFDLKNGSTVWKATDERASYSSPTSTTLDGQQHVIFVTRMNAVSIDPRTGAERFRFSFGRRGPTVNAATPLVFDGQLFVSAAYGVGAKLVRLRGNGVTPVWANDESMSSQYSTCVQHRGYLYGTHGREDFANGELRCVEAATGEVQWNVRGFGVGHVILAGDRLLILNHEGQLTLATAAPRDYQPEAEGRVSSHATRAIPALSNGRFFFRDNAANGGHLRCVSVSGQ